MVLHRGVHHIETHAHPPRLPAGQRAACEQIRWQARTVVLHHQLQGIGRAPQSHGNAGLDRGRHLQGLLGIGQQIGHHDLQLGPIPCHPAGRFGGPAVNGDPGIPKGAAQEQQGALQHVAEIHRQVRGLHVAQQGAHLFGGLLQLLRLVPLGGQQITELGRCRVGSLLEAGEGQLCSDQQGAEGLLNLMHHGGRREAGLELALQLSLLLSALPPLPAPGQGQGQLRPPALGDIQECPHQQIVEYHGAEPHVAAAAIPAGHAVVPGRNPAIAPQCGEQIALPALPVEASPQGMGIGLLNPVGNALHAAQVVAKGFAEAAIQILKPLLTLKPAATHGNRQVVEDAVEFLLLVLQLLLTLFEIADVDHHPLPQEATVGLGCWGRLDAHPAHRAAHQQAAVPEKRRAGRERLHVVLAQVFTVVGVHRFKRQLWVGLKVLELQVHHRQPGPAGEQEG